MTKSTLKKSVRGVVSDPLRLMPRDIALLRDVWEPYRPRDITSARRKELFKRAKVENFIEQKGKL